MVITLESDIERAYSKLRRYEKVAIPKASVRTLNRIGPVALKDSINIVVNVTRIKKKELKKRKYIYSRKASPTRFEYRIVARKKAPNLVRFMSDSQKRKAVEARKLSNKQRQGKFFVKSNSMGKGNRPQKGAFLITASTGRTIAMKRTTSARKPIMPVFGPNIAAIYRRKAIQNFLIKKTKYLWTKQFNKNLSFYVGKINAK